MSNEETDAEMKIRIREQGLRVELEMDRLLDLEILAQSLSHGLMMAGSGFDMMGLRDIGGVPVEYEDDYLKFLNVGDARPERIYVFAKALQIVTTKIGDIIEGQFESKMVRKADIRLNGFIAKINERKIEVDKKLAEAKEKWENELKEG